MGRSGSVSSEDGSDQESEICGSYCLSADVSESESSSSFSGRRYDAEGASSSMASSPLPCRHVNGEFCFPTIPQPPQFMLPVVGGRDVVWNDKPEKRQAELSEIDMMKERFAKLLLGEDMSGGGKGVCTALAISNAITNLSATVFGELWRLEPLAQQKKALWCREMEWLLCVSDSIVELVPSIQQFPGGGTYEIMATRPRSDLYMNLPALKKLDAMLISILEGFQEMEFSYVDQGIDVDDTGSKTSAMFGGGRPSIRQEEKWWLPCPKIPPKGLSEEGRKRLQQCRDCTNQILKAAMAINSSVLAEMEIPSAYTDTLPKDSCIFVKARDNDRSILLQKSEQWENFLEKSRLKPKSGKDCLGEVIYRYITSEQYSPECLLDCLDLSSEHHTLEMANRIEAALHVWKKKHHRKHLKHLKAKRSTWGGKVKNLVAIGDKNHFLAQRAETLLHCLKLRFPGLPQTALDMNKIQYNKDVGQSILESYSRVMESLAFNIMARIDDVIYADDVIRRCVAAESKSFYGRGGLGGLPIQKRMSPSPFSIQNSARGSPFATPTFCSSPPLLRSPDRVSQVENKASLRGGGGGGATYHKLEGQVPVDLEKLWSYAGNLSSRRVSGDAPERD